MVIRGVDGEHYWTIFVVAWRAAAVVADRRIRIRWDAETRRATGGLETLPDFIALPRDEQGRPIIPRTRVTALVEAQQAWESELGTLDAVTATIVVGKLAMPKVALPSQQTFLRNHPSWEQDPKAKEALGPVIAKWLLTGVLEYVAWNDRMPVLLQPCGAVPALPTRCIPIGACCTPQHRSLAAPSTDAISRSVRTFQMSVTYCCGQAAAGSYVRC